MGDSKKRFSLPSGNHRLMEKRTHNRKARAANSTNGLSSMASVKDHWVDDMHSILQQHREKI